MEAYYLNQAGSGIAGYSGVRYQRGNGFFGRLIRGGILPLIKQVLPYFGRNVVATGANIMQDVLDGKEIKASTKRNLSLTARRALQDGVNKTREYAQKGGGVRKKPYSRPKSISQRPRRGVKDPLDPANFLKTFMSNKNAFHP
jgi:hypothetical protein